MLTDQQLSDLTILFRHGAEEASLALSRWLARTAHISIEQIEQALLSEATVVLGEQEEPVCCCCMELRGRISGQLILEFDDASGLALTDLLLERPLGTSTEWNEVEQSAALETANIIGCAYLNSLARQFSESGRKLDAMLPTPPRFARDYAEALMQFALMNQAMAADVVFLTRTELQIDDAPVHWNLLLVPDSECLLALRDLL